MNTALEVLHGIREHEGLGWDGPKVRAWGAALERANQLRNQPTAKLPASFGLLLGDEL